MKISFEDRSYIEIVKSQEPNKLFITVAAKNAEDSTKLIANCVEITEKELLLLIKSAT